MRGDAGFPVRLRFAERGKIRWISHRDLARAFERAFRTAQLPLAFTAGFAPRPKVSFGPALSVGYESDAEYLDVELAREIDLAPLAPLVSSALPEGIDVTGAVALADRAPALMESVTATVWRVEVVRDDGGFLDPARLATFVADAMAQPVLETTRRRKGVEAVEDVRPVLRRLDVLEASGGGVLTEMELSTQPRSARPGDVLAAITGTVAGASGLAEGRVLRTHQWIERDGARQQPLDADPRRRAAEARAS